MIRHVRLGTNHQDDYEEKGSYCRKEGYHCRGETWAFSKGGAFEEAPLWSAYAQIGWFLTFGLDLPGFSGNTLVDPTFTPLYRDVFNRYATSIRPPVDNWIGAIVSLRDGLDSANTKRFPEQKYGKATQQNADRMKKIVKDFADRGAIIGDIAAATGSPMQSRVPRKMNDIGWRIWEGNYGNGLLTQLAPNDSSEGLWRIGPKDQEFGRFARQFNDKRAMGFVLDTRLWGGLPMGKANARPLVLSVAYFDGATSNHSKGSEDWAGTVDSFINRTLVILYDGQDGCTTSASIHVGATNRWKVWNKTIVDGKFGKKCLTGADIALQSVGGDDIAISTVAIYDPNGRQ